MRCQPQNRPSRKGFALIVVLSTLGVIAVLFAISSDRIVARVGETRIETRLLIRGHDSRDLLRLATESFGVSEQSLAVDQLLPVKTARGNGVLRLKDVGGLVDLNTAAPELLDHLADALDISAAALSDYRRWRRKPHRLVRVSDFVRLTGADPETGELLQQIATVYSGRQGVSIKDAPDILLSVITGESASRKTLEQRFPDQWVGSASGSVFDVWLQDDLRTERRIGTIRLGDISADSRILTVY